MTTGLIELRRENTTVEYISNRNNVIIIIKDVPGFGTLHNVAINKKYFNQIHTHDFVQGRVKVLPEGLWVFEGFSFK